MAIHMLRDHFFSGKLRMLRSIACVGSLDFQERECVEATSERYVLLDELIETTISRAEHEATHAQLSQKWTRGERASLLAFAQHASELFDENPVE
jgi:hypothetical protein